MKLEPVYAENWPNGFHIIGWVAKSDDSSLVIRKPYKCQVIDELKSLNKELKVFLEVCR